jgi:hypothetical protein
MKNFKNVNLAVFFTAICLIGCVGKSVKSDPITIDLTKRNTSLTNSDIIGTYKGSYTDSDLGYTTAAKITINADGTFIANVFIGGEEQTKNGLSPQKGTYKIRFEKEEIKNPYGEVTGNSYTHGIDFNANTPYGIRTSTYLIKNGFQLVPISSFIDESAVLKKNP